MCTEPGEIFRDKKEGKPTITDARVYLEVLFLVFRAKGCRIFYVWGGRGAFALGS